MTRLSILAAATAMLLAAPAYAYHCPADAAAIDHALGVVTVSAEVRSEVETLRNQGMEQHEAGNHDDAVNTLSEAMRLLLNGVE